MTAGTDLTALNTLKLHATAQHLVTITSSDQLQAEIAALDEGNVPHVLGGGSNVILCDHLRGTTLLMAIKGRELLSDDGAKVVVRVGAGESWHDFVVWCHHQGFHGLANLALIPGSVGGAPIQNIGAYGVEVAEHVEAVHVIHRQTGERGDHGLTRADIPLYQPNHRPAGSEVLHQLVKHAKPVVLQVGSGRMAGSDFAFHVSENGVWLTARVPSDFIVFPEV